MNKENLYNIKKKRLKLNFFNPIYIISLVDNQYTEFYLIIL